MHKLKIGDLVCFNSGGMKHKTLGIVMDFDFREDYGNRYGSIQIMWSIVGKYMPRRCVSDWRRNSIESGDIVWHHFGDWFLEVK